MGVILEVRELVVNGSVPNACRLRRHFWIKKQSTFAVKQFSHIFARGVNIILGPNGSGKSLLLRVLAGLVSPNSGCITVDGRTVESAMLRRISGYLPQSFGFYPQFNAREMLNHIALLKGIVDRSTRESQVEQVLQRLMLVAVAERKLEEYSRGMRQKVGIAQALLGGPPLLLLDDPTAGLDPDARQSFRELVIELGQNQVIIWASSLITDCCSADRVLVMDGGQSRFWGTPAELGAGATRRRQLATEDGAEADQRSWSAKLESGYRALLANREEL